MVIQHLNKSTKKSKKNRVIRQIHVMAIENDLLSMDFKLRIKSLLHSVQTSSHEGDLIHHCHMNLLEFHNILEFSLSVDMLLSLCGEYAAGT